MTWLDAEGAFRSYVRTAGGPWGQRAYFGTPEQPNPTLPMLVVSRIGGGPQLGEAPLDDARLSVDVWGITKFQAVEAVKVLTGLIQDLASTPLDAGTIALNGQVDSVVWAPDDTLKLPRYVVDCTLTLKALD